MGLRRLSLCEHGLLGVNFLNNERKATTTYENDLCMVFVYPGESLAYILGKEIYTWYRIRANGNKNGM